jgi:hypothetical protein
MDISLDTAHHNCHPFAVWVPAAFASSHTYMVLPRREGKCVSARAWTEDRQMPEIAKRITVDPAIKGGGSRSLRERGCLWT